MANWPHERSLAQNLAAKPFALIGVSGDNSEPKRVKEGMDGEEIN
jgi:hypothetical protein